MLGKKARDTNSAAAVREFVEWSIPFTQRDCIAFALNYGQQIAEAPHSTLIDRSWRELAISPNALQIGRVWLALFPARISDLKKISALRAAEILAGLFAEVSAADTAEAEVRLTHFRR